MRRGLRTPSKVARALLCPQSSTVRPARYGPVGGQVRAAFVFTIKSDKIIGIDLTMDLGHLAELDVSID